MADSTGDDASHDDPRPHGADPVDFRVHVVAESIRLFSENGYEATSVDQIAAAAGMSRRTFFRQFRSKEDVIFLDHEALLAQVEQRLRVGADAPWQTVCEAAEMVFAHFRGNLDLAVRRFRVVQEVPALRDRELITTYRYQGAFEDFLRTALPARPPEQVVAFAAAVTAAHNFLLRSMLRGDESATPARLRRELAALRAQFAGEASGADSREVTVVSYSADMPVEQILAEVSQELRRMRGSDGQ